MKKELRQRFRDVLLSMSPEEMQAKSAAAARLLFESKLYRNAKSVMVFISLPMEIDTTPVALRAWRDRKRVLAPRISWEQRRMLPVEIHSLTENVVEIRLGIREPVSGRPAPISGIDLVLVPGVAFDKSGNRLGRGRGFYEKFLSHAEFHGVTCAYAFEEQVAASIPVEPGDRPVQQLITDKKVRRFTRRETAGR